MKIWIKKNEITKFCKQKLTMILFDFLLNNISNTAIKDIAE